MLVALNLQTSFLTPPMAMSAYYLKGIAPQHVQLWTIFRGCLPFLGMVFVAMSWSTSSRSWSIGCPTLFYGKQKSTPSMATWLERSHLAHGNARGAPDPRRHVQRRGPGARPASSRCAGEPRRPGVGLPRRSTRWHRRAGRPTRAAGRPSGRCTACRSAVKDIIDTADMPTENGTVLHAGRRPATTPRSWRLLRAAGAVIMGKTVTTELADLHARQDAQPARSRAHARRLVERLGGGGGRRHGATRDRHPDQRLGDPARRPIAACTASSPPTA